MDYADYADLDGHDPPAAWAETVAQWLDRAHRQEADRLEQDLERIADQLERRDTIHEELTSELEWKRDRYTDRLADLYRTGRGKEDGTREQVKDRIAAVSQELREERRAHWRDRQELEQERRAIQRELAELTDESLSELLE